MKKPTANRPARSEIRLPQFRDLRRAVTYAFKIDKVRPYFSYQMLEVGDHDEPFESFGYELHCTCVAPDRFAGRITEARLSAGRGQSDSKYKRGAPVGRLTLRGKVSELDSWLPIDALHWTMQHVVSEKVRYLTVIADPLKNGYADAHVVSFEADLDPDEYPGIAADG